MNLQTPTRPFHLPGWAFALLLVCATVLVYEPAWRAGFTWDDHSHVEKNPAMYGPGGLERIWFSRATPQYYPLVFTSFWLERFLFGTNPTGYRLDNLILHGLDAVLLWQLLMRLGVPGARLAAAIFALHPVNVETAAWITERKNTLAMCFYLLSIICYLRSNGEVQSPRSKVQSHPPQRTLPYYWISLVAFVLALLSKTAVAPLPFVLLLCIWWRQTESAKPKAQGLKSVVRSPWSVVRGQWSRLLPFFAAPLVMVPITILFEHQAGSETIRSDPMLTRLAGAGCGFWLYLSKTILPWNLLFTYPKWELDSTQWFAHLPWVLIAALFTIFWACRRTWGRAALFGMVYFLLMLLPVLGFINIYAMRYTSVSDHWQYFGMIGPIALVAAILSPKSKVQSPKPVVSSPWSVVSGQWSMVGPVLGWVCVAVLACLTCARSPIFISDEALWKSVLRGNPNCWLAYNNLGRILFQRGELAEAKADFESALRANPQSVNAHYNLANVLRQEGRPGEALQQYRTALEIYPGHRDAHINLGMMLAEQGNLDEAIAQYETAIALPPDYNFDPMAVADAHYDLAVALLKKQRTPQAVEHLQAALQIAPNHPAGRLLERLSRERTMSGQ
ncbi:MAG: hypothetical protein C5B50_17090 [Verrucomicrobia bacterium]|nr:MAG: hypothetical protein C5B50_17090 [Verrucomicrobiota bacterium]